MRHVEHVDRELDVHIALDLSPAHGIRELLGGLGHHGVSVVIEPIDQRPQRRIFLILDQRRIVESAHQAALRGEEIEQALVVDVEAEPARGGIEIGAVDEYRDPFLRIEHGQYAPDEMCLAGMPQ